MDNTFLTRLENLTGNIALERLARSRVAVFGLGSVGSWAAEALVRSGIGQITLIDDGVINGSHIHCLAQAHPGNVGRPKSTELKQRLLQINPQCQIQSIQRLYKPENSPDYHLDRYDYVLDCLDTVPTKVYLIIQAVESGAQVYSSVGAAFKLDPSLIRTGSIWRTDDCPLAGIVRRRLRDSGFFGTVQTVYSSEPVTVADRKVSSSAVFVTACFGMTLAGLLVRDVMALVEQTKESDPE